MGNLKHVLLIATLSAGSVVLWTACGSPSPYFEGDGEVDPYCRENPGDCAGEIGGDCFDDSDCFDGTCCHDKNCGDGMCTYLCNSDSECPSNMRCEHDTCFFECGNDNDCGPGQKCEHGKTICEYEGGD